MVCVHAAQVVNVQRGARVVDEALEKLVRELGVKRADHAAGERNVQRQAGAPREVDDHARERFVQRHIGMAIAADALFIAHGTRERLANGDTHVFDRVVAVDVQIALGVHFQVDQAMACDLLEHVVKKTNTGVQAGLARAVEIQAHGDARLGGIAADFGRAVVLMGSKPSCLAAFTVSEIAACTGIRVHKI